MYPKTSRSGEDSGAASLVGVILMVAVVIVIAATLALFALSFGEETTEVAPVAQIEFESNYFGDGVAKNDSLTIVHTGGDELQRSRLEIVVGNDTVFNETDDSESNSNTPVPGLIVEVDDDEFNDLNKPGDVSPPSTVGGPPGDSDGSDPGVVHEWTASVRAGQRLVIQERNASKSYDVLQPGEQILVIWHGEEESAIIARGTVAPEVAD